MVMQSYRGQTRSNPIVHQIDGWYFWDETWSNASGPYHSYEEVSEALRKYAESLG